MSDTIPRNAIMLSELIMRLMSIKGEGQRLPVAVLTKKGVAYLGPVVTIQDDRILIDTTESMGGR